MGGQYGEDTRAHGVEDTVRVIGKGGGDDYEPSVWNKNLVYRFDYVIKFNGYIVIYADIEKPCTIVVPMYRVKFHLVKLEDYTKQALIRILERSILTVTGIRK